MEITIEKAKVEDVGAIWKVAKSVEYDKNTNNKGFLLVVLSKDKYKQRIKKSHHFFVAKEGNKIVGFVMAYTKGVLESLKREMPYEMDAVLAALKQKGKQLYLEQLGVLPKFQRKGVAQKLYNHLVKTEPSSQIVAEISLKPKNEASINFFVDKNRWTLISKGKIDDHTEIGVYGKLFL